MSKQSLGYESGTNGNQRFYENPQGITGGWNPRVCLRSRFLTNHRDTENAERGRKREICSVFYCDKRLQIALREVSGFVLGRAIIHRVCLTFGFAGILWAIAGSRHYAWGQVVGDNTLGAERSQVTSPILGRFQIEGGATRGTNLFHSFSEFSVPNNGLAYFNNALTIQNIITRVTGGTVSNLNGTIAANGTANLFLINPNGIIFGLNASLNIGGSFVGSTASSLNFPDGTHFSATATQTTPLLTISVPLGLQYGTQQPGSIVNAGNLAVQPGQNITLVGGTVVTTGQLKAPSGQINVMAVPGESLVQLGQGGRVLSLSHAANPQSTTARTPSLAELLNTVDYDTGMTVTSDGRVELKGSGTLLSADVGTAIASGTLDASNPTVGQTGGTVQVLGNKVGLFDRAAINVSGDAGGGRVLMGGNYQGKGTLPNAIATYVDRNVTINADANNAGNGGQIVVWANDSTRAYGTMSARGGAVTGNGGLIETSSRNFLDVSGIKVDATATNGLSGTWLIDPRNIIIQNATTANGTFSGGNPNVFTPGGDNAVVNTQDIEAQLNQGTNVTITTGSTGTQDGNITVVSNITKTRGGPATLTLEAANNITMNQVQITSRGNSLNLLLTADSDRSGSGDAIVLGTGEEDAIEIQANGGNIGITANSVLLDNRANVRSNAFGSRNGGQITVNARSVLVRNGSGMGSNTSSVGNAGQITINADVARFEEGGGLSSNTFGRGNAGQITLNVGSFSLNNGGFGSNTEGSGNGGQININANTIALENSGIGTASSRSGNAGQINVIAGSVSLKNSAFTSDAYGRGNAGQINVTAGSIGLTDYSVFATNTTGSGKGGQITIQANSVTLTNHASIDSKTEGSGDAGEITINADVVSFKDVSALNTNTSRSGNAGQIVLNVGSLSLNNSGFGSNTTRSGNGGQIVIKADAIALENSGIGTASGRRGTGNAGQIEVTAGSVWLKNSAFNSETSGRGNAGQINVKAGSISLSDRSVFASSTSGQGNGGNINIQTETLSLNNDAEIAANSRRAGSAGNIQVSANSIHLNNHSSINANTTGGQGNINLNAIDIVMRRGSEITTNATGSDKVGGNITINTGVLAAFENSDTSANSTDARGGNVKINAQGIFGTAFRPTLTPKSDITATGKDSTLNGTVEINILGVNPIQGLVNLPVEPVNVEVAQGCQTAETQGAIEFFNTGRGGLAANPYEPLSSSGIWEDVPLPAQEAGNSASTSVSPAVPSNHLVEAQGWLVNEKGEVVLIAEVPTNGFQSRCR
jgi:filamentous hemagglutinin family protein